VLIRAAISIVPNTPFSTEGYAMTAGHSAAQRGGNKLTDVERLGIFD
jgi:hypothetical protein